MVTSRHGRITHDHPDRDELLKAARTGRVPFQAHLDRCEDCRSVYELMTVSRRSKEISKTRVSPRTLSRAANLPLLVGTWMPGDIARATPVYDSWRSSPATALRDAARGMERRLRFTAGRISLELVVERRPEGYSFVARCYQGGRPSAEYILKVGRERLQPEYRSCYFWTSRKPPRNMQLLSPFLKVDLDRVQW